MLPCALWALHAACFLLSASMGLIIVLFCCCLWWSSPVWCGFVSSDVYKLQSRKLSVYSAGCGGRTCWSYFLSSLLSRQRDCMCQKRVHRFCLESHRCFIRHVSVPHPPPGGQASPASSISPRKGLVNLYFEVPSQGTFGTCCGRGR